MLRVIGSRVPTGRGRVVVVAVAADSAADLLPPPRTKPLSSPTATMAATAPMTMRFLPALAVAFSSPASVFLAISRTLLLGGADGGGRSGARFRQHDDLHPPVGGPPGGAQVGLAGVEEHPVGHHRHHQAPGLQAEVHGVAQPIRLETALDLGLDALEHGPLLAFGGQAGVLRHQGGAGALEHVDAGKAGVEGAVAPLHRPGAAVEGTGGRPAPEAAADAFLEAPEFGQVDL